MGSVVGGEVHSEVRCGGVVRCGVVCGGRGVRGGVGGRVGGSEVCVVRSMR